MSPIREADRAVRKGQEMLEASGDVIARRLEIMAEALRDPVHADLTELSLMGSEKVEALTESATVGLNGALNLAASLGAIAARETAAAQGALQAAAGARTPLELLTAQTGYAGGVVSRAAADGWALGAAWMRMNADALAPVHRAAVANAKRLKK